MIIYNPDGVPVEVDSIDAKRPYYNDRGQPVIAVNTGRRGADGEPVYQERPVTNATLRKDEWIDLDEAAIGAARERLVVVDDLIQSGLTYNVGGLGQTISEWEALSEMDDATVSMDGETVSDKDRQATSLQGVPIPIIHKDFKLSERVLQASRTRGASLDVTSAEEAGRSVARVSEGMVFNGLTLGASNSSGNTYTVYGLTNHPSRAIQEISDWSDSGVSEETILSEILDMVEELETEQRAFGPFNLYIPSAYNKRFHDDYKSNSDKTLMQRVLQDPRINAVRTGDKLADGNVVLLEMTKRVIDLAIATNVVNVQWNSGSGMTNFFKTYAAWAPRIKTDYDGRVGFLHGATST